MHSSTDLAAIFARHLASFLMVQISVSSDGAVVDLRHLDLEIQRSLEPVVSSAKALACFSVGSPALAIKVPAVLGGPLDPQLLGALQLGR